MDKGQRGCFVQEGYKASLICRNAEGHVVSGSVRSYKCRFPLLAEAYVLRDAVRMASIMKWDKAICESNSSISERTTKKNICGKSA
ncbi:conserved hypothetical protein [Ricinus communis]|uniref:RNase H type-1 domain-containing protein n=1 Tax=Ricinus communis TaxID=3988 RepID=B9R749_RICCO|nr:conserved hypothetical protein [Ricinus communis]